MFIIFNTKKKAERYIKHLLATAIIDDGYLSIKIQNNLVISSYTYDAYCSSSQPEIGYICCSGNFVTHTQVLGKLRK